jgi:hypothetical protein
MTSPLAELEKRRVREWDRLKADAPSAAELGQLRLHLAWLRLSPEAKLKTEWLPGMGRRRGDRTAASSESNAKAG